MNSRDPIAHNPEPAQELFRQFGLLARGFPHEDVLNAAANMVVNALRQSQEKRDAAEKRWDEVMGRAKGVLMDCYDSAGRKKGVFPYPQHIVVPKLDMRRK